MKTETLKTIIRAFNCVTDDQSRYALTHVYVRGDGERSAQVIACDGHALSEVYVQDEDLANRQDMYFPKENKAFLVALLKKHAKALDFPFEEIVGFFTPSLNGMYPSIDSINAIKCKPDDNAMEFSFDAELLLNLAKSLEDLKGNTVVKIKIPTNQRMIMQVQVGKNIGTLMGCRL